MEIKSEAYYRPNELSHVGAVQTLASWRFKGVGPAWTYSGRRVLYLGRDVLTWLGEHRVETN